MNDQLDLVVHITRNFDITLSSLFLSVLVCGGSKLPRHILNLCRVSIEIGVACSHYIHVLPLGLIMV